jgi:hypothetical protein
MTRTGLVPALLASLLTAACAGLNLPGEGGGAAARRFEQVRTSPPELRAFLAAMPKGADLHSHLSGATYAESFIRMATAHNLCLDVAAATYTNPPCTGKMVPATSLPENQTLYTQTVNSQSLRDFVPASGWSGHDQFFSAFRRFGAAAGSPGGTGDMLAEVVGRAGNQHVLHVELMLTAGDSDAVRVLADKVGWNGDAAGTMSRLMEAGLGDLIPGARGALDGAEARMRQLLGCGGANEAPGCFVSVRYLQQVSRNSTPARVFAQTLFAFILAQSEPRVVGVNFVGPEDYRIARTDYTLHMQMIDALRRVMPTMNVALHAGELTLGLVPPEDLRFHIRQAVELGHARRIGHGVDIMYEDDPWDLLREMAGRHVAVETNLSSNEGILGVWGAAHPFPVYRRAGVPTVISTDDEGISRSDLTNELHIAVLTFGLSYADLTGLARNSLEYSFLPGASLWADAGTWGRAAPCAGFDADRAAAPPAACSALLEASEKARVQWRLERALAAFERDVAAGRL